jgi:UDP-2,3-diacylglucosamine hydrolase
MIQPDSEGVTLTALGGAPLGIVAGRGTLPYAVAGAAMRQGHGVVLFGLIGFADPRMIARYPHHWIRLGQFARLCRLARREGCGDLVLIGGVERPTLWQLRPDFGTLLLLPRIVRIFRGGDGYLLSGVAAAFEDRGFQIVGAHDIAPEILMPEGAVGRRQPGARDHADIARGLALLQAIGPFDVGQAAVIGDNRVLAIEAAEGTDRMLRRIANLRRSRKIPATGGVLVKAPKPGQDRRIDLPSIGPRTIESAALAGLAGIAVVAGSTVVADLNRVREAADRARVFVIGVDDVHAKG